MRVGVIGEVVGNEAEVSRGSEEGVTRGSEGKLGVVKEVG